jgi:hypothetical protein
LREKLFMDFTIESQTKGFLNGSFIPALTAYEYRGYVISAWARPEFTNGSTSVGIVYERSQLGSIIQVQRIEDELFESKAGRATRSGAVQGMD